MKWMSLALLAMAGLVSNVAMANAELAKEKNCMGCHAMDRKVVGPAFKEVSAKYAGQKDAENKLVERVLKGTSGAWGPMAMPANTNVSEKEAHSLVKWILSQK